MAKFNRFSFQRRSMKILLPVTLAAFLASGCAGYDVEFDGALFEAAGLNNLNKKQEDPKVKERAGIVMPPKADLPEPGARKVATQDLQWPDDPDIKARRIATLKESERKKYCSEIGRNENAIGYDEKKAAQCQSLLSQSLNGAFGRAEENEDN